MNDIVNRGSTEVGETWKWKSRSGWISPKDMSTRHLMSTVLMIWNHAVPVPEMQTHDFYQYQFGPEFTPSYFRQSVRFIMAELETRDTNSKDIHPTIRKRWRKLLSWMGTREVRDILQLPPARGSITGPL